MQQELLSTFFILGKNRQYTPNKSVFWNAERECVTDH